MNPPPAIWSSPRLPSLGCTVLCRRCAPWGQRRIRLHLGGSIGRHGGSAIPRRRRMPEYSDQRNERERGDTRYQVQNGCLSSSTHAIFHSFIITRHSHREYVRKAKSLIPQIRKHLASKLAIVKLFVLPSEPSLKFPFRVLGARRYTDGGTWA